MLFFFFNDPPTTETSTLPQPDALPIPTASLDPRAEHEVFERFAQMAAGDVNGARRRPITLLVSHRFSTVRMADLIVVLHEGDRKSTRLNSSHANISYAVFCLKNKNHTN